MASKYVLAGMLACMSALAASSAVRPSSANRTHALVRPGAAPLRVFGGRSLAQRHGVATAKFDATLADLSRHAALAAPGHVLADLHSMSPAARFKLSADGATPLVSIDAVTRGDAQQLKATLEALGLERAAVFANDVGGWLPVAALPAAAARTEVHSLRAALSRTRSGAATSQGDFVQSSLAVRTNSGLTGAGLTVGVLSDSYDCYSVYGAAGSGVPASGSTGYASNGFSTTAATDVSTGDLPSGVSVLEEADCLNYGAPTFPPLGDEGRAMLQIVHDVAPGAGLAFYTADNSEADFAAGIAKLAAAGARVIADDVGYFDEPFYQDGLVAQAIDAVAATGVSYFSAAGNDGDASYENTAPAFTTLSSTGATSGEYLLNFDTNPAATSPITALPINLDSMEPGELAAIVVEWDQPFVTGAPTSGGASSRLDVCITGATSAFTVLNYDNEPATCTGANAVGVDPVQILIIANPANATANTPAETLSLTIGLADGTAPPGRIKVVVETDGQSDAPITQFATYSATLQGHPGAAGAAAVGAAFYFQTPYCGTELPELEAYSARGGAPILFDVNGTRLATPIVRQKPDFVAPDGVNDTFLGTPTSGSGSVGELTTTITQCQNDTRFPNFFGTSAASPHAAGIAALLLQANPALSASQVVAFLQASAVPMAGTAYSVDSGYGFVQALGALALTPPGAPTLSLSAASVTLGKSVTLTWGSFNTGGCTASGAWAGSLAASGVQTVTPGATGTTVYSLVCTNAVGTSTATTASLTTTASASPSGGGGGGAIDWRDLAGLAVVLALACGARRHAGDERTA